MNILVVGAEYVGGAVTDLLALTGHDLLVYGGFDERRRLAGEGVVPCGQGL